MRRESFFALILILSLVPGCPGTNLSNTPRPQLNQNVEPLAGISFKPLTSSNASLLSDSVQKAPTNSSDMAVAPSMPSMSPGGNYGYYGQNYGFDELSLVSASEAETAGYGGASFSEMVCTVVTPVIREWADDARLIRSDGDLAADGTLGEGQSNPAWRLSYVSSQRKEAIDFVVGVSKTLILRQRWAPLVLDLSAIGFDSADAVKKLKGAIEDGSIKSEEEKTGIDYFLHTPLTVFPAAEGMETLYQLPAGTRWNVSLRSILGHLVWDIGCNPSSSVAQEEGYWTNYYARGMVDAQNGTLIHFSRPTKNKIDNLIPPTAVPMPARVY